MIFSKKFQKLIESQKSESLLEDKSDRRKRREERREKRLEKKFNKGGATEYSSPTGDFNLNAFYKALEALKNQIIAQLNDTDTIKKLNPDLKSPDKYNKIFVKLLERTAKLMGDVAYTRQKEGKKLDSPTLISGYRDLYNQLELEFKEDKEKYTEEIQEERITAQKGLKFKTILDPINRAIDIFKEAEALLSDFLSDLAAVSGVSGSSGSSVASSIIIEKPIKKWKGGAANETVKKVQKLIHDKFKGVSAVTASSQWKKFYGTGKESSYADGKNGTNTSNLIIALNRWIVTGKHL